MSSIIPGTDFQRYTSDSPVASLGELVFHGTITIPNNFSSELTLPVVFTDTPLHALGRYGRKVRDTFLTLKYISISSQKSPSFSDKHRGAAFQINQFTIPGSTSSPETIYFSTGNPTFFSHVLFVVNVAANFTVDTMSVQEHNSGHLYPTGLALVAPFATAGPQLNLQNLFDPIDGLINFSMANPGFDLGFTAHNTNAGAAILDVSCYGSTYAYDWIQMLVRYQDWQGNIYNAGVFDDLSRIQTFPLGQQVQSSIINPAQLQFGQVLFDPINFNSFFNTGYTYDVVLSASIDVFLG